MEYGIKGAEYLTKIVSPLDFKEVMQYVK